MSQQFRRQSLVWLFYLSKCENLPPCSDSSPKCLHSNSSKGALTAPKLKARLFFRICSQEAFQSGINFHKDSNLFPLSLCEMMGHSSGEYFKETKRFWLYCQICIRTHFVKPTAHSTYCFLILKIK